MISIMMPVYNAGDFLKQAIESILQQTEKEFELLIINDGSTDNSEEIILSYKDPRIVYLKKENGGESSARNMALSHAKGSFIVFQDADDVSLPNRLELLKKGFISESIGFVHSDMLLIDENDSPIGYWQSRQVDKSQSMRQFLKIGTPFNNPSMMVRKEVFEDFQYDTSLKIGPDTDMVSRFAFKWDSFHIDRPLLLYRRHSNNISKQSDYDILFTHARKFINQLSLKEMIPELNWKEGNSNDNELRAKTILTFFMLKKGMSKDAQHQFHEVMSSIHLIEDKDVEQFIFALGKLMTGKYQEALYCFSQIKKRDAVTLNYIGETFALMGQLKKAKDYFLEAITLQPAYQEPLDNLKSLGGATNFNLIDTSWLKFKK